MSAQGSRRARYVGEIDEAGTARIWHEHGSYRREVRRVEAATTAGLGWGYIGSAPADTARTILADAAGDRQIAEAHYLDFVAQIIETLPCNARFELPQAAVDAWLANRGIETGPVVEPDSRLLPADEGDVVEWARELEQREQRLERWASQLAERERAVGQAEARTLREREAITAARAVETAWSLPALPVARELRAVMKDAECTVEDAAREFGIEPRWARAVIEGTVTEVDVPHVQQVCEGWSCTPYDFWGTDAARTIVHAYPPELWPRHIAPLWEWEHRQLGPEPGGPELGI